jgi:hypothetical protein
VIRDWLPLSLLSLVPLAGPVQALAQEPWSRPVPIDLGGAAGVTPVRAAVAADGFVAVDVAVDGEVERLPFVAPVRDLEVGRLDGGVLIVLAGGVREDLDLYRFDPGSRAFVRYGTEGGRRLRSSFADGLGSWPLADQGGLLLFAFEREDSLHFRAVVGGRVLASRALPVDCQGFAPRLDQQAWQVGVEFAGPGGGAQARLEFAHPTAPRLRVLDAPGGRVDFGAFEVGGLVRRTIRFENFGGRVLAGEATVEGGFALTAEGASTRALRIEPEQVLDVDLWARSGSAGPQLGRLVFQSPQPEARASIELRAIARAAPEAAIPGPPTSVGETEAGAAAAPARAADPDIPPPTVASPVLARPDQVRLEARWRGSGRLLLVVRLAAADRGLGVVWLRVGGEGAVAQRLPVQALGRVECEIEASALDPVELAAAGPTGPVGWDEVGRIPPALRFQGPWVVVHGPRDSVYELLQVDGPQDGPRWVLRRWQGRTDGRGLARFDAATFAGEGAGPVRLQLAIESEGRVRRSQVLEIGPSGPASRHDR